MGFYDSLKGLFFVIVRRQNSTGKLKCNCQSQGKHGGRCEHILALQFYEANGPFSEYISMFFVLFPYAIALICPQENETTFTGKLAKKLKAGRKMYRQSLYGFDKSGNDGSDSEGSISDILKLGQGDFLGDEAASLGLGLGLGLDLGLNDVNAGEGAEEPGEGAEEPGEGAEEPGEGAEEPGEGAEEPGEGEPDKSQFKRKQS